MESSFNTLAIAIASIAAILSMIFVVWQARYWHVPMSRNEKISRSLKTGLGLIICMVSSLSVLDLTRTSDEIKSWNFSSLFLLICFSIPIGVIAAIGSYVRFTNLDKLRGR